MTLGVVEVSGRRSGIGGRGGIIGGDAPTEGETIGEFGIAPTEGDTVGCC